jgi:hypothetical protein
MAGPRSIQRSSSFGRTGAGEGAATVPTVAMHRYRENTIVDVDYELERYHPAEDVVGSGPGGVDVEAHIESVELFRDTGSDRIVLHNAGEDQESSIHRAGNELLPRVDA